MNLDDIFLKKVNLNMAYFKIDKIHLNTKGSKALAKEVKRQISYSYIHVYQYLLQWFLSNFILVVYVQFWFFYSGSVRILPLLHTKWVDCSTYYDKVDDFQELINGRSFYI